MRREIRFKTVAEVKAYYEKRELAERDALLNEISEAMDRNAQRRRRMEAERETRIIDFHDALEGGVRV